MTSVKFLLICSTRRPGKPLSQATFKRLWCRLMLETGCVEWRTKKPDTSRENDILKCVKPVITPHWFQHNFMTIRCEASIDPLIAMKIVGYTDRQPAANSCTHIRDGMLKKSTVNKAMCSGSGKKSRITPQALDVPGA